MGATLAVAPALYLTQDATSKFAPPTERGEQRKDKSCHLRFPEPAAGFVLGCPQLAGARQG
jgi:hypothetical protein